MNCTNGVNLLDQIKKARHAPCFFYLPGDLLFPHPVFKLGYFFPADEGFFIDIGFEI
jgi:hypothetical protein